MTTFSDKKFKQRQQGFDKPFFFLLEAGWSFNDQCSPFDK
jgi:hypothetical protein